MDSFFVIGSDQITRLKAFDTITKKINAVQPLNPNCLFVIDNNKLSIYGYGGGAFGHGAYLCTFDIESSNSFSFLCPLQEFIKFLEKSKSEKINISFNDETSRITIKGSSSRSIFSSVVLATTEKEKEEITSYISSFKGGQVYASGFEVILTDEIKEAITNFSSMTGLLKTNDCIVIEKDIIKSIDNVSIIKQKFNEEISPKVVYINKSSSGIIEKLSKFRYCELDEYSVIYGNIDDVGVEFYITQPEVNYQNVTDEESSTLIPTDESKTVIEIKSEDLLEALNEFDGVFSASSWIYKQVYFKFDKALKTIGLEYNDMANQCFTELSYEEKESINDDGQPIFLIPTIHIKYLKSLISSSEKITMTFNLNDLGEPNSQAIIFENDKIKALLMKMSD